MDRHARRSPLRFELPAPGTRRSLCIERLERDVCEGLRCCMEQGHEPRSLRPGLSAAKNAVNFVRLLFLRLAKPKSEFSPVAGAHRAPPRVIDRSRILLPH